MHRPRVPSTVRAATAVLAAVAALTLGGCGSDGDSAVIGTEPPAETSADTTTSAAPATEAPAQTETPQDSAAEGADAATGDSADGGDGTGTGSGDAGRAGDGVAVSIPWELREPPTYTLVTAVDVRWPTPVPKDAMAIGDIDGGAACTKLAEGGAFPGVLGGDTAGTSIMREGDVLTLGCTFQGSAESPIDLDAFQNALRDALGTVTGGESPGLPPGSYGIIEVSVVGDPTKDLPELDGVDTRPGLACAAAAAAVGLPDGWSSGGTFRFNDDTTYRCNGPIPDPPSVTADDSVVAQVAGDSLPPRDS